MVQEASGVDLAESFLRRVVSKLLEPSAGDRIFQSSRCLSETFRSEVSSRYSRSRRLRHVDLKGG